MISGKPVAGQVRPANAVVRKTLENACIAAAALEAAEIVLDEGSVKGEEFCRKLWATQQKILKERYQLDWETPFLGATELPGLSESREE